MNKFFHGCLFLACTPIILLIPEKSYAQPPKELKPILEVAGADSGSSFGEYVRGIGDLNKDGFSDVAVSAPHLLKTYVYYGGKSMSKTPALTFEGGGTIAVGDLNGDGWIDLAIEKWFTDTVLIYFGGPGMDTIPDRVLAGEHKNDAFGHNSLAIGDLDGDGFDDLVIGAPQYPYQFSGGLNGKIYIYAGGVNMDSIPRITFIGDTTEARLGQAISIGDINGDGKKDIVALGWNMSDPHGNLWYFYLAIYKGMSGFNMTRNYFIDSRNIPGGFADNVVTFDADGDNLDDILVNKIYIIKGGATIDTIPTYYVPPPNNDTTLFGQYPWVSGGGDFNGDGIKDILVSATQGYFGGVPGFYVMVDKKNSPGHYIAYRVFSEYLGYQLGGRPEDAGDVNGDGVDDIIIGAPNEPVAKGNGFVGIYSGDTSLIVGVKDNENLDKSGFKLLQNYPNPFNSQTIIEYSLDARQFVSIKIMDTMGGEILPLVGQIQNSGYHRIVWDGMDNSRRRVASGIYYCVMQTEEISKIIKIIHLK